MVLGIDGLALLADGADQNIWERKDYENHWWLSKIHDNLICRLEMAKGYDPYNNNAGDRWLFETKSISWPRNWYVWSILWPKKWYYQYCGQISKLCKYLQTREPLLNSFCDYQMDQNPGDDSNPGFFSSSFAVLHCKNSLKLLKNKKVLKSELNIFGAFWECKSGLGYFIPQKVPFFNVTQNFPKRTSYGGQKWQNSMLRF